jgi:hypothetical protein
MTEVLDRPRATSHMFIQRRRRITCPQRVSLADVSCPPAAASITDPSLTTEQYNRLLAGIVRSVPPMGI